MTFLMSTRGHIFIEVLNSIESLWMQNERPNRQYETAFSNLAPHQNLGLQEYLQRSRITGYFNHLSPNAEASL